MEEEANAEMEHEVPLELNEIESEFWIGIVKESVKLTVKHSVSTSFKVDTSTAIEMADQVIIALRERTDGRD